MVHSYCPSLPYGTCHPSGLDFYNGALDVHLTPLLDASTRTQHFRLLVCTCYDSPVQRPSAFWNWGYTKAATLSSGLLRTVSVMLAKIELPTYPTSIDCLAWSPDGELAIAANDTVHLLVVKPPSNGKPG